MYANLINKIITDLNYPRTTVVEIVRKYQTEIVNYLFQYHKIEVTHFGSLALKKMEKTHRIFRNIIPPHFKIVYRPSNEMRRMLKQLNEQEKLNNSITNIQGDK